MPSINESAAHTSWVKDGTAETAPVTTSTPELTPATGAGETSQSGGETASVAQATAAGATTTVAAQAAAAGQTVAEFLEARLNGQPYQLPKGVELPWKRGNETGFVSVEELQKRDMLERDYRLKTAALAEQKRSYEAMQRQIAAEQARVKAREAYLAEQEEQARQAFKDPGELQRWHDHLQRYQSDPHYRRAWDDSLRVRETEAELSVYREAEEQQAVIDTATQLAAEVERIVTTEFPGVDVALVRERYAQALMAGQADMSEMAIRHFAKQEAAVAERVTQPLRSELDEMRKELAALKKERELAAQAAQHNATTSHALNRAAAPNVAPAGGAPPAPPARKPREAYTADKRDEVHREWINRR